MNWKLRIDDTIADYFWLRTKINREYVDACVLIPTCRRNKKSFRLDNSRTYISYGMVF